MNRDLDNSQELLASPSTFGEHPMDMFYPKILQMLGQVLPDAMFATDRKGLICVWNAKAETLFGYSTDFALGKDLFGLFPQFHRMPAGIWRTLTKQKQLEALPVDLSHRDGHKLCLELSVSLYHDEEHKILGAVILGRERSPERLSLPREWEQTQQRLDIVLEQMQDAVMFTDVAYCIQYVNPAWEELNGYTMAEVQGLSADLLKSDKTSPSALAEMKQAISRGQLFQGEVLNRRKDGSQYEGTLSISPLAGSDGEVSGFVGVIRNVSVEKVLLQAQENFVAGISHELRTPLTNIKFYLSLLERGRRERHSVYLSTLKRETDRLHYLIEGLLNLSQMDQGYVDFRFDALDLNDLLSRLMQPYAAVAQAKGLKLNFVPEESLPPVLGDSRYLEQVAFHLLENAIRYTPEGGSVVVSTFAAGVEGSPEQCSDQAESKPNICFAVQDTGLGIPENERNRIFERFYRGRNARQLTLSGSGLGLSISREVVLRHGGTLEMSSQVGQGSTFTVRLKPANDKDLSP